MDAQHRRQIIARRLAASPAPLSAAALAKELAVSRQIIVGDVALLRAGGMDFTATPRGYLLPRPPAHPDRPGPRPRRPLIPPAPPVAVSQTTPPPPPPP